MSGFDLEKLPKEVLLKCLRLYSNLFLAIDGFWYLAVKERFGDDVAIDRDLWVWGKYIKYELKRITRLFEIEGDDVETLFKALGVTPWAHNLEFEVDLKDKNWGVLKVRKCPTLTAIMKEGEGREKYFCKRVEQPMLEAYAKFFSPKISVRALRIPPETIGSDVCCEWEFRKG